MVLLIECVILCGLFSLLVLPKLYKNPLNCIMSYPKPIRDRVASLPQYQATICDYKTKHIQTKILFVAICVIVMAFIALLSGCQTVWSAFLHVFILFFAVNMYDLLILDLWLFCHSTKVIIPGTEDMVKDYKAPSHHLRGAFIGTLISLIIATLSSVIVGLYLLMF